MVGLSIKDPIREQQMFGSRAVVMFLGILVLLGVLILRFVQLQVWEHETYQTRSEQNRIQIQPLAPPRGLIFDRHGELLADNRVSSSLALVTERIDNLAVTMERLARLVRVAGSNHLYPMRCMPRSLVLQWLLGRRGVEAHLRIGRLGTD